MQSSALFSPRPASSAPRRGSRSDCRSETRARSVIATYAGSSWYVFNSIYKCVSLESLKIGLSFTRLLFIRDRAHRTSILCRARSTFLFFPFIFLCFRVFRKSGVRIIASNEIWRWGEGCDWLISYATWVDQKTPGWYNGLAGRAFPRLDSSFTRGTEDKYFPSAISFSWRDDWNNTLAAVFSFV